MKIRDLNKGEYIIVYDLGKSEYSEGMTVVGKVVELEFDDDDKNKAVIDSVGSLYTVTDENYFDNWQDHMESITESVDGKRKLSATTKLILDDQKKSNDMQQRKRGEQNVKPDYYQFDDFEMYEIVEAICKHYNPVVAAWIGQAIQYIGRAPRKNGKEDIGKARDMIEQAFKSWDK